MLSAWGLFSWHQNLWKKKPWKLQCYFHFQAICYWVREKVWIIEYSTYKNQEQSYETVIKTNSNHFNTSLTKCKSFIFDKNLFIRCVRWSMNFQQLWHKLVINNATIEILGQFVSLFVSIFRFNETKPECIMIKASKTFTFKRRLV